MPEAGIEPARRERRGILNPLCLPISPLGHRNRYQVRAAGLSIWRHVPESNRTKRICNPLHNRFANAPCKRELALYCLNLERETRLELATPTLARSCSTNWAIPALGGQLAILNVCCVVVDAYYKDFWHCVKHFCKKNSKKCVFLILTIFLLQSSFFDCLF